MKINVLFFGITTDLMQTSILEFSIPKGSTVTNFRKQLQTDYPQLANLNTYAIALNEEYTQSGVTKNYTSARLNSTFPFSYGKIEVKAKLPQGQGTWPAIWTLGTNINELGNPFGERYGAVGWPDCGEIDIMEQNGWQKSKTIGHLHWGNTKTGKYENQGSTYQLKSSSENYHLYTAIWNKDSIQLQVDDEIFLTIENTEELPYDNPHYVLLNMAVGGNLGGNLPERWEPQVFEIDYVRIYQ